MFDIAIAGFRCVQFALQRFRFIIFNEEFIRRSETAVFNDNSNKFALDIVFSLT